MAGALNLCGDVLKLLEECIKSPDRFVESQPEQADHFKTLTKQLYKLSSKLEEIPIANSRALPKLLINGFDEEQIWQQMELKNIPSLKHFEKAVKVLNPEILASSIPTESKSNDVVSSINDSDSDSEKGYAFDDDTGDDSDAPLEALKPKKSPSKPKPNFQKKNWESEADDQFFKYSQMEEFLKLAELEAEQVNNQSSKKSEEFDYFAEVDSDDLSYDEDEVLDEENNEVSDNDDVENAKDDLFSKTIKSSRDIMYEDFFDPPISPDEDFEQNMDDDDEFEQNMDNDEVEQNMNDEDDLSSDNDEHPKNSKEYDTRDYDPKEEMKVGSKPKRLFEDDDDDNAQKKSDKSKTPFDIQQEKNRKRIKEMEANLLKPKPWQLTGEIAASNRPENSLMRQPTTFDVNPRQNAIDSTVDLTSKLEDIIKMAISNKAWADVERKIKPKEDLTYKRRVELDQSKSKKSLAEIYEEDFLKLKHKTDEEEEDAKHTEIRKLMDALTPELYALFSHIPKPPVPEIKVVNNLPAISVEEIAPVGLSNAQLLAPEEVKRKPKGDLKSDAEKSATDKKRERRKKKLRQKFEQKKTDEKMRELAISNPALAKKHEKLVAMKKLKQHKNTVIVNTDHSKKIKSSKDFFSRLEETVHSKKQTKLK